MTTPTPTPSSTPAPTPIATPIATPLPEQVAGALPLAAALQAALAGEHAAIYGFGVVGGKLSGADQSAAAAAFDTHRQRRDQLVTWLRRAGQTPVAAAPAYALPFPVTDGPSAHRLAAYLEERLAADYANLVAVASGSLREFAATTLTTLATTQVSWGAAPTAFPGLPELGD